MKNAKSKVEEQMSLDSLYDLKRNNTFPLVVSVSFRGYYFYGTYIPGGFFIERVENRKQQDSLLNYIQQSRYVLDERKQKFEVISSISLSLI